MCIGLLIYTRSGLVSLSEIPNRWSSDVTSPFPPSGNEGYIRNRDDQQNEQKSVHQSRYDNNNLPLCFFFHKMLYEKCDCKSRHVVLLCMLYMRNESNVLYIYISGGPLSALTCCVNVRLLSAIKKISPLIYSQSWVGSWVYTTQAMMTFTLIF